MFTNYIKNFGNCELKKLYTKLIDARAAKQPVWAGTVYIGKQPLYIECFVPWMANKIEEYFFKAIKNEHISNAKELYILNDGVDCFIKRPNAWNTNVFWTDNNIYRQPDVIAHFNCIFCKYGNKYIISVDSNDKQSNFYHLGENHLLMRLFGYIFDTDDNIVLHGAVVGNEKKGVLITGLSGAGKSTLAAHCLRLGLKFVSDDRVALHMENDEVFADPIYTTVSLIEPIGGLKTIKSDRPENSIKDVIVLDKSQISESVKVTAIIEPVKSNLDEPVLSASAKAPILTRICSDYSNFSLLTRSMNPLDDYKKISSLFSNVNAFNLKLSNSVEDNAKAIYNFINQGDTNV